MSDQNTGTSNDVLDYYSRNWEKIANCYEVDAQGIPADPAWYRRRLYGEFLERAKPASILDIGCGGGWTVLDALEKGVDARGIEPVLELKEFGNRLLKDNGHDPDRIQQDDLASCTDFAANSMDAISLLSVLPHVPRENWDAVHTDMARSLKPGGRLVAAYRNELFDLFTFNSITLEFFDQRLWGLDDDATPRGAKTLEALKGLMSNPDKPGQYFTAADDKSFGKLDRMKNNPLTLPEYHAKFGLEPERISFYHFHCVPPLMEDKIDNYREISHKMELSLSNDWRGHFMAAMFLVESVKK